MYRRGTDESREMKNKAIREIPPEYQDPPMDYSSSQTLKGGLLLVTEIFEAHGCISRLISREFSAEYSSFFFSCGPRVIYFTGKLRRLRMAFVSLSVCIGTYKCFSLCCIVSQYGCCISRSILRDELFGVSNSAPYHEMTNWKFYRSNVIYYFLLLSSIFPFPMTPSFNG